MVPAIAEGIEKAIQSSYKRSEESSERYTKQIAPNKARERAPNRYRGYTGPNRLRTARTEGRSRYPAGRTLPGGKIDSRRGRPRTTCKPERGCCTEPFSISLRPLLRPRLRALLGPLRSVLRVVARRRLQESVERGDRLPRGLVVDLRVHLRVHEQGLPVRPRRDPGGGPEARDDLPVPRLRGPERLRRDPAKAVPRHVLRPSPAEFVCAHRNRRRHPRADKSLTGSGGPRRPPCSSGSPGARAPPATRPGTRTPGPRSPSGARGRTPRSHPRPGGRTRRNCGRPAASPPRWDGSSRGPSGPASAPGPPRRTTARAGGTVDA